MSLRKIWHRKRSIPRGRVASRRPRLETLESRRLLHGGVDSLVAEPAEGEDAPMPDFSLVDVNQTSPTHGQLVSPRDRLQEVSAWYFGHGS